MKISPFIVTLAMGEICAGFILVVTRGWAITGLPDSMIYIGQGSILYVPIPVWIMIVICIILAYVLKKVPFGRHVYALGGNESAAQLVGIKVAKVKMLVFGLSGMLAALSGILLMGRLASAQPTVGAGWVMPTVTAAIIGGTSLSGGEGGVVGTLIGAALMGVLTSAIVLFGISAYWERVIIGSVVLAAVAIDRLRAMAHQRRI
jgi:ribose transport system permease protein